ncbi:hypothetical protein [Cytobacillus firmus]|uniref:hypothetical protein n=1 Tax=Cytobacillus firmus TaxID=1399 RepID=UPI001C8DE14D|nr:hypothetical protein [Cytobacillus firmus]MBX9974199.1 hypothetical protein [Cytobacillus firmus]
MIKNDTELEISKESLAQFLSSLKEIEFDVSFKELSPKKQEIYRKALEGEVENLQSQINEYELLKSGKVHDLFSDKFTELPLNLIRARIAKGFDEQYIANYLNIDVADYIELEDELFAEADITTIIKLINLLNIEIPTELKKMFTLDSKQIMRNVKNSLGSLFDKLIPFELKEEYNLTNGYLKLFSSLKKIFNENINEILSGSKINNFMLTNARYKTPKGTRDELVYLYTSYAEFIAREISKVIDTPPQKLTTNPMEFRTNVIEKYGNLSLETCISYLWDLGIPVIPFEMSGGFHGACWRFNGRNVIVLKQQSKSPSRWLFDLLHEYWHATQEPDLLERETVDLGEILSAKTDDQEEMDANKFAEEVIFEGRSEELFDKCITYSGGRIELLRRAVQRVALNNYIDLGALANYTAYRMSQLGESWWATAQNLQQDGNPYSKAYDILISRLDSSMLHSLDDPLEQELIENALYH